MPKAPGFRSFAAGFTARALLLLVRGLIGVRAECPTLDGHGPRVYFANHASHADFVILWAALPPNRRLKTRPVAAADYWLRGFARRFLAASVFRSVLIDRVRAGDSADPIDTMARVLDAGDSLILFPEGARNTGESKLLPLKSGLVRLVEARPHVECVPVWIDNAHRVLPKGEIIPVPLPCTVRFGRPLGRRDGESQSGFLDRARSSLLALSLGRTTGEALAKV